MELTLGKDTSTCLLIPKRSLSNQCICLPASISSCLAEHGQYILFLLDDVLEDSDLVEANRFWGIVRCILNELHHTLQLGLVLSLEVFVQQCQARIIGHVRTTHIQSCFWYA